MKKQLGFIGKTSSLLCASILLLSTSVSSVQAKTLKLAYDADPVSLDIHEQLSGGMLQLSHMTHDPLVRWTKDFTFEPRLASKWERVDANTVRFHLREGVKFHSGNTMTAADVKWTYDRLKNSPDFKGIFANFKDLKVVDDKTIELVTDGPYPLVMHTATYIFPMDSKFFDGKDDNGKDKAEIVKNGASFASTHSSGTGPYTIESREQGVKVVFKRFADYWDKDSKGNVDEVVMTPIKDNQTRVAALLSGDVDFIAPVAPNEFGQVESNDKVQLVTMAGTRVITFQLNQERRNELKDAKVRQAITYAINNVGIVKKIMKGFATAAGQMSPKGYLGYDESLTPRFDIDKAKKLMSESSYPKGFTLTMMAPNNRYVNDEKIAQAVAAMLSKIDIKIDLKTMPKAQYWPEFDKRSADIMMIGWHSDTEDSANFYEFLAMTPNKDSGMGAYNSGNYSSKFVDETTVAANKETDNAKRASMLQSIEQKLYSDAAFVPLHWQNLAWASRKGVNIEPIVNAMNFPYIGDLVIE